MKILNGFTGSFSVTVDSKGRVVIPVPFRDLLLEQCNGELTIGLDATANCLVIHTRKQWEEIKSVLLGMTSAKSSVKEMKRILLGPTKFGEIDTAGRLLIPKELRLISKLKVNQPALLIGNGKSIELWKMTSFSKTVKEIRSKVRDGEEHQEILDQLDY